jgi:hypothetical protein
MLGARNVDNCPLMTRARVIICTKMSAYSGNGGRHAGGSIAAETKDLFAAFAPHFPALVSAEALLANDWHVDFEKAIRRRFYIALTLPT